MPNHLRKKEAVLFSASPPNAAQRERFLSFIEKQYGKGYTLLWKKAAHMQNGFVLEVGSRRYDWSGKGMVSQLSRSLHSVHHTDKVISLVKEQVAHWAPAALAEEVGTVKTVGDGIATLSGLENVTYNEIVLFPSGVRGMIQELSEESVGCILFDEDGDVCEGDTAIRTGKSAGVPVGEAFLGRVVDALGNPIDGKGDITAAGYRAIEHAAPGILERQPVKRPLETGILAIDAMFPIGRGQRELIIGDRQTGKTAIAVDTIVNQKGKDVICLYVAIGQKASSVALLTENLKKHGAMEYTTVVCATAASAAPLQYIAPYAGCAMAEYFMEQGKDVLIIYDDLSKHAIAYRAMRLLLGRSPGREAYPGDVFHLHSRLLERAARLSEERGGGSMTALPIVETQAGDVSAYIPTNIISITDGQIYLESSLFFAGQRPAINVGLSVSRVGGDAQSAAMKMATGSLRLSLAQYREMEVFTQFSGDLDEDTKKELSFGESLMHLLIQPRFSPLARHRQVIALTAALSRCMEGVSLSKQAEALHAFYHFMEREYATLCERIEETEALTEEDARKICEAGDTFFAAYKESAG